MTHEGEYDPWVEFRRRREEWRAARHARREAWRAAWRARREARRAAWLGHGWGHWGNAADWSLDPSGRGGRQPEDANALKTRIAEMEKTIAQLNERIIVLEKLATNDDARLAAEIEKLRGKDEGR